VRPELYVHILEY